MRRFFRSPEDCAFYLCEGALLVLLVLVILGAYSASTTRQDKTRVHLQEKEVTKNRIESLELRMEKLELEAQALNTKSDEGDYQ